MKTPTFKLCALLFMSAAATSHAVIHDFKRLSVDFTNLADATNKATWAQPGALTVSTNGLGWDGEAASMLDGWIQTVPLALGLSWRPPFAISVRASVQQATKEVTLANGQKSTPDNGDVYVRYSPDLVHWSSWQALQRAEPQSIEEKKNPGRYWNGTVRVPYRNRAEYDKLLSDYSRLDVPWKSDEEATVQWILDQDPEFFAKQLPFIGYVEFLFETSFRGGQRIQSLNTDVSYGMGGLHSPPKDQNAYKDRDSSAWRFKAGSGPKSPKIKQPIQQPSK